MDQQDMTSDEEASTWPGLSADLTLPRSTARTITLDTQRASSDGRILEVTAQLDLMRTRLLSLEQHVFDTTADAGASEELLSRFVSLDAEIADTTARFGGLASRVAAAEESVATTMMQPVDGFDARLVMVEDARLSQTTELNQLTSYLEQAFTRITELAELIEFERVANASFRSKVATGDDRLDSAVNERFDSLHAHFEELTERLNSAATSIDQSTVTLQEELSASMRLIEDRLSASEVRLDGVDEISSSMQFLQARADALETDTTLGVAAATSHRLEIVDHVDHAHARIDETQSRVDEARTELREMHAQISQPTEEDWFNATRLAQDALERVGNVAENADLVGQRVDIVQSATDELAGGVDNLHGKVDNAATAIDAAHTRIDDFAQAFDERFDENHQALDLRFNENRHALDERLAETHQTIRDRIDAAGREIDELREAVDSANAAQAASAWTEDELRRTNERIASVSANINSLTTLREETTHRFGAVDRNIEGVDERIDQSFELATRARDHGEQISSRLDQQDEQLAAAFDAASSVAEKASINADRLSEAVQNIAAAQQRLEENLAVAAETTSRGVELHNGLQASIDEAVDERSSALEERLLSRIEEAHSTLQSVVFDSENKAVKSRETLRRDVEQRIDAMESDVLDRQSVVDESSTTDVRLEALEATQHTVDESLRDVEGLTKDAHAFSESLRLIQADVVQTIQGELRTQTNQMQTLDVRVNAAESANADFASAERVHMLEAKLVEALQTVSQLTQLQRRNTTVEAQLTDTLTATSHGVESTQNSIVALRRELEQAQSRIAQLESLRSVHKGEGVLAVSSGVTTPPDPVFADLTTEAPRDLAGVEDDADTGWFTESYARKNQEPKPS